MGIWGFNKNWSTSRVDENATWILKIKCCWLGFLPTQKSNWKLKLALFVKSAKICNCVEGTLFGDFEKAK